MANTFTADLRRFADLTNQNMKYVATEAIQDVVEGMLTPQRGVSKGGSGFVEGKIPVAEKDLINSLVSGANGSFGPESPTSYVAVIAGMDLGDVLRFGFTADHALRMELGFTGTDSLGRKYNQAGRHFVGKNAARFPQFVARRAGEVRR
jgi:hypothetical protein